MASMAIPAGPWDWMEPTTWLLGRVTKWRAWTPGLRGQEHRAVDLVCWEVGGPVNIGEDHDFVPCPSTVTTSVRLVLPNPAQCENYHLSPASHLSTHFPYSVIYWRQKAFLLISRRAGGGGSIDWRP